MIRVDIYNNQDVSIITDDGNVASFLDNKCNVKTKFNREGDVLLLGKLPVLQDLTAYFFEKDSDADQDTTINDIHMEG